MYKLSGVRATGGLLKLGVNHINKRGHEINKNLQTKISQVCIEMENTSFQ